MHLVDPSAILKEASHFVEVLVQNFGTWGTVLIALGVVLLLFGWRRYNDYQRDKRTDELIKEKDKTIQRLAEQERNLRVVLFKHVTGWSDEQLNMFIMKNDFEDVISARKALEDEMPKEKDKN